MLVINTYPTRIEERDMIRHEHELDFFVKRNEVAPLAERVSRKIVELSGQKSTSQQVIEQLRPFADPARPTRFNELPMIFKLSGCSPLDYLEQVSVDVDGNPYPVSWADEHSEKIATYFDSLNEEKRTKLYDLLLEIAGEAAIEMKNSDMAVIHRARQMVKTDSGITYGLNAKLRELNLKEKWGPRIATNSYSSTIPVSMIPFVSKNIGVPLHWLMAFPDDLPILAKNGISEAMTDLYILCPNEKRQMIDMILDKVQTITITKDNVLQAISTPD